MLSGCKVKENQLVEIIETSNTEHVDYTKTIQINTAISDYIENNIGTNTEFTKIFQAHELYGIEEVEDKIYSYLWTHYREFYYGESGLREGAAGGAHPIVVVLKKDQEGNYYGVEHRIAEPESGEDYTSYVRQIFPSKYVDKILAGKFASNLDLIVRLKAENFYFELSERLNLIVNNPAKSFSSNPFDYIEDNENYKFILEQSGISLNYFTVQLGKSNQDGLKEYIMALACAEILGEDIENKEWSSGKEWYKLYQEEKVSTLQDGSTLFYGYRMSKDNELSIIIKSERGTEVISNNYPLLPSISPYTDRIAYLEPWLWEEFSELYIYNPSTGQKEVMIKQGDIHGQLTPKSVMWFDDRFMLVIIGPRYGTVSVGGDLYILDTLTEKLYLYRKVEIGQEIKDISLNMKEIVLEVAHHNEERTDYIVKNEFIAKAQFYDDLRNIIDKTTTDAKSIKTILENMKSQPMGVTGWETIYAGNNRVIIRSHSYLLLYEESKKRVTSAIDLMSIDGGFVQGSICTNFSVSPNGRYVIINNGSIEADTPERYKMYFCDLNTGKINVISEENYFRIRDGWSQSSDYYVFGDTEGRRVSIFDIKSQSLRSFDRNDIDNITNIYVSNNGDIAIDSQKNASIYNRSNKYFEENLKDADNILGFKEGDIVYFYNGSIFKTDSKNREKVKEIGEECTLVLNKNRKTIFLKGLNVLTYSLDNNQSYKYEVPFPQGFIFDVSPDASKVLMYNGSKYQIIHADGRTQDINQGKIQGFAELYAKWIDNNNVVMNIQQSNRYNLGNFSILKYDVEKNSFTTLLEP